jgi:hypothetical protein
MLARIRAAVDKSEELIDAPLTLARSDRGLGPTEVAGLPTAVEDAIDSASPAAPARQVRIDTALRPAQVTGDRVLRERLISNLIDNAVRHNVVGGWVLATTGHEAGLCRADRGQRRRADPCRPGERAVRAVPPPVRAGGKPVRHQVWPVHRGLGGQGARRPGRGARQARWRPRSTGQAAHHRMRLAGSQA